MFSSIEADDTTDIIQTNKLILKEFLSELMKKQQFYEDITDKSAILKDRTKQSLFACLFNFILANWITPS
jgi:hypothetical protein